MLLNYNIYLYYKMSLSPGEALLYKTKVINSANLNKYTKSQLYSYVVTHNNKKTTVNKCSIYKCTSLKNI